VTLALESAPRWTAELADGVWHLETLVFLTWPWTVKKGDRFGCVHAEDEYRGRRVMYVVPGGVVTRVVWLGVCTLVTATATGPVTRVTMPAPASVGSGQESR
jgi:hypothetical protein